VNEQETDITQPNPKAYKILKHLNIKILDSVTLNIIDKNVWLIHFVELWTTKIYSSTLPRSCNYHRHNFTLYELNTTLTKCKNNKTPGEDLLNMELFKYATLEYKIRLLAFFNTIFNRETPRNL
jgi:hypothetical protein